MSLNINNNPLIDAYILLESIIRTNVQDVNETRRSLPTSREKQWIYPQTPEEELSFYPVCAIILNDINYSELGSNQFAGYQTDPISGEVTDLKMNFAILNMTIGIFTKKKDKFTVTLPGQSTPKLAGGTLLNAFLTGKVINTIQDKRDSFLEAGAQDIIISRVDMNYVDNEILFASNINITLILPNIWGKVYTTGELIEEINQTYTVSYTLGE